MFGTPAIYQIYSITRNHLSSILSANSSKMTVSFDKCTIFANHPFVSSLGYTQS